MAMKRRKSRKLGGLAGSPEHHSERARRLGRMLENESAGALKAVHTGNCISALTFTISASDVLGELRAHSVEAGKKPGDFADLSILSRAKAALRPCVVAKGKAQPMAGLRRRKKLSGMSRRRSSSRRLGNVIDKPEQIEHFRNLALLKALETEVKFPGFKMTRGPTAYSRIKAEFGLKGTKAKVLEQFYKMVKG